MEYKYQKQAFESDVVSDSDKLLAMARAMVNGLRVM